MSIANYTNDASAGQAGQHEWSATMARRYGLQCDFTGTQAGTCAARDWYAGPLRVLELDLDGQHVSLAARQQPVWREQNLLVKVVRSGLVTIGQNGDASSSSSSCVPLRAAARCIRKHLA